MKSAHLFKLLLACVLLGFLNCRVVKFGQFYLSENHQKPKQEKVVVSNNPTQAFQFAKADKNYQDFISNISYRPYRRKKAEPFPLSEYLDKKTRTTAFLVVKKDTILFEEYYEGYDQNSLLPSWSVSKSFSSALAGIAIQEGYIKASDTITKYLPELKNYNDHWNYLTVNHLLNMRSGIDFDEDSYINPYSSVADLYMSKDFMKLLKKVKFIAEPGSRHYYSSLDTELLGLALEKALNKSLSKYLEEKIWIPLGMESEAEWTVDSKSNNNTKAFCCLNATLRDYAKFARLYLNHGNWNGTQIIDSSWIAKSVLPDFTNNCYQNQWYSEKSYQYSTDSQGNSRLMTFKDSTSAAQQISKPNYQHPRKHWTNQNEWIIQECGPDFYALGIFGQEVYIDPESEMIFIRLGKKWDTSSRSLFSLIKNKLKRFES